jgi:hypothetical protein
MIVRHDPTVENCQGGVSAAILRDCLVNHSLLFRAVGKELASVRESGGEVVQLRIGGD